MDITAAVEQRRSVRAFLDTEVEPGKLNALLRLAGRAPSAINLQPWEVTVVSGQERHRLSNLLVKRLRERRISCSPGAKRPLPPLFLERQRELMQALQRALGPGQAFETFINEGSCRFYGAPAALIVSVDEVFSSARLLDLGIFVGYLLLGAEAMGLGTCPIGLVSAFDEEIRELINLKETKRVVIAVAVGYPDSSAPVNRVRSTRADLSSFVRWRHSPCATA